MKIFPLLSVLLTLIFGGYTFIIPDEVPSLLSVIYSNIPIIKKGTDSRLGWGFRLGNRADFQVLVELGPQQYTQPLGNQGDNSNSNKRNTPDTLSNELYAIRQHEKHQKEISNTQGGNWLEQWSKNMKKEQESEKLSLEARPGLGIGEIDAKSVIADDSTLELTKLYERNNNSAEETTTKKIATTTSRKEALDNVELDDE